MFELLKGGAQEPTAPALAAVDAGTAPPVVRFRGIRPGAPA